MMAVVDGRATVTTVRKQSAGRVQNTFDVSLVL